MAYTNFESVINEFNVTYPFRVWPFRDNYYISHFNYCLDWLLCKNICDLNIIGWTFAFKNATDAIRFKMVCKQ